MVPTQNCFWQNIKFSKDQFWGHYYFYSISTIYTRQTFPKICHFAGETNFLYENPSLKDISRRINYDIHINYILGQNLNCWLEDVYSLLIVEKYNTQTSIYSFFFIFAEISQMLLTLSRRRPDRYHIETSPLIYSANQWTGFYMITASVLKGLKKNHHSRHFHLSSRPLTAKIRLF